MSDLSELTGERLQYLRLIAQKASASPPRRCALRPPTRTYHLCSPQAVLVPEEVVREAQILGELLQQVYAEAGAAAVEARVRHRLRSIVPGGSAVQVTKTGL